MKLFEIFGEFNLNSDDAIKDINKVDKSASSFADKLGSIANTAGKVGLAIGGAFATAAVAIAGSALKATDEYKKALNGLVAETGANMEEMGDVIKDVYANNFGESFEDVAKSIAEVKKQMNGLEGKELQKVTENALLLRDTFDFEVNESIRAVNSLMTNMGITSEEAFDLIARGAQEGLNVNDDLLDTINEYSNQFKALGFEAGDMFDILKSGAESGAFSIDKVGDAIKEFNIRSKDMSKASLQAFKDLGFAGDEMSKRFAQGGETAQMAFFEIADALSAIEDPIKKNELGVALFGTQFEDLEAGAIDAILNINSHLTNVSGTLDKMNEIKYDTFGEAIAGIGRQLQVGLIDVIGEKLLPYLNMFSNWISEKMPIILETMEWAFEGIGQAIDLVIQYFTWLKEQILDITQTSGIEFETIIENVKAFVDNMIAFFTEFYEKNKESFDLIIESVKEFWGALIETFQWAFDLISEFWAKHGEDIQTFLMEYYTIIIGIFTRMFEQVVNIFELFTALLRGDWEEAWNVMGEILETTKQGWLEIIDLLLLGIATLFGTTLEDLKTTISDKFNAIKEFFTNFKDSTIEIFTGVFEWFETKWSQLGDLISAPFEGIKEKIDSIKLPSLGSIGEGVSNVFDDVKEGISGFKIPGFATGTMNAPGGLAMVGEQGPEIVDLPKGSKVYTNQESKAMMGNNINNNFNIGSLVVREEADVRKVAEELYELQKDNDRAGGRG